MTIHCYIKGSQLQGYPIVQDPQIVDYTSVVVLDIPTQISINGNFSSGVFNANAGSPRKAISLSMIPDQLGQNILTATGLPLLFFVFNALPMNVGIGAPIQCTIYDTLLAREWTLIHTGGDIMTTVADNPKVLQGGQMPILPF